MKIQTITGMNIDDFRGTENMLRHCNSCKKELPIELFHKRMRGGLEKYRSSCQPCEREAAKKYYHKNIDVSREKGRIRARENTASRKEYMGKYREDKKDELLQYAKDYYYAHQDKYLEGMSQYREIHREEMNAYKREFYKLNREGIRDKWKENYKNLSPEEKEKHLARAKEYYHNNQETMTAAHREWLQENPDKVLVYSHKRRDARLEANEDFSEADIIYLRELFSDSCANCGSTENLEIDHHYPLSKGHPLSRTNAVLLCVKCNRKKHAKLPEKFYHPDKLQEIESKLFQGQRVAHG